MEQKDIGNLEAVGCAVGPKCKRGVCPRCRTFVGVEALIYVRESKICPACTQREIELWNNFVKALDSMSDLGPR